MSKVTSIKTKKPKYSEDPTVDLGFRILDLAVDDKSEANVIDAMALAFVALMAGPDKPLQSDELTIMLEAISLETRIWNDMNKPKAGH